MNPTCKLDLMESISLNGDKLTCLDVAVLLRNAEMVKLLQRYQAKESSACKFSPDDGDET